MRALYADPHNWAAVFSKTIRAAHVLRREAEATIVEVDHAEGRATNILRDVSPTRIELREFTRRYDATFVNDFISEDAGMRFALTASVLLKWPYRLAEPLLKPLVLKKMRRYVVEPLKRAAEDRPASDERTPGHVLALRVDVPADGEHVGGSVGQCERQPAPSGGTQDSRRPIRVPEA